MDKAKASSNQKTHELRNRIFVSLILLSIYVIGRSIVIYGVDVTAYLSDSFNPDTLILSMVSGDRNRVSIMALGIMPYITTSLIISFVLALGGKDFKSKYSAHRIEKYTFIMMSILSLVFACSRAFELTYIEGSLNKNALTLLAVLQMMAGVVIVYFLAKLNKDYGIAGQSIFIVVNLIDTVYNIFASNTIDRLRPILIICVILVVLMIVMEKNNYRLQVQRVSIHNMHAEKNFIEYKLNPIGVMPVMFASSFTMLFRQLFKLLALVWPTSENIFPRRETFTALSERLVLTDGLGVASYLVIIVFLAMLFSFVLLSPSELSENLQTGGDSIVNIYAGTKTKKHISRVMLRLSIFSGCFLSVAMGVPLLLSLQSGISTQLAMLPSSVLMVTGLISNMFTEIKAYFRFDSYKFFM